jgi:hypothetical protein
MPNSKHEVPGRVRTTYEFHDRTVPTWRPLCPGCLVHRIDGDGRPQALDPGDPVWFCISSRHEALREVDGPYVHLNVDVAAFLSLSEFQPVAAARIATAFRHRTGWCAGTPR